MNYSFNERLAFSKGQRQETDLATIRAMIPGCAKVEIAPVSLDRTGVDYIATLRRGAQLFIDAKARDKGCSQFWTNGPELALEIWSIVPENEDAGKAGWTLDEAKKTDLVLFTFAKMDTSLCFLVSFQLLRIAFRHNYRDWLVSYKTGTQDSGDWRSQCVFVPAATVLDAIREVCIGRLQWPMGLGIVDNTEATEYN